MSFFGRRKRERGGEPSGQQPASVEQELREALRRAAPEAVAEGAIVDFASQSLDDHSLREGYLVLTREQLVWAFAPELEVHSMDIRQGIRLHEDEQLAPDFARLIEVASNGSARTFLIPHDSAVITGLTEAARPSNGK